MSRILIVDDSSVERFILKKCLEKHCHEIIGEATNCQETLEMYEKFQPDIVILDIVMPNDNGLEILEQLMNLDKNAKVIMCTSAAHPNTVIKANQLGAKHFLAKPVTNESLLQTVQSALYK